MGFEDINNRGRASISSQDWRATASPNTNSSSSSSSWRRTSSVDSGYESSQSHSTSPSLPSLSPSRSLSPLSRCTCHQEYTEIYRSYKEQERIFRRWLCSGNGRTCAESDLDDIEVGGLVRMANRIKNMCVPFSVAQGLKKAIKGRKAVIGGWHFEETDHTCEACGRFWRKLDENHKHHIRELERMLLILGIVDSPAKTKVDPLSVQTWR